MQAIVLVGGFGTRLRPLTYTRPKQMLPVVGRPLIEHVVGRLVRHGVDEVVLALGYKPDAFTEQYPDGRCAGARLIYAVEPEPLDTAGAIGFAARTAGVTERCLVLNGDVLTDLDLTALVATHDTAGAEATIHLHPVDDPSRFGVVPTWDDGRVIEFVEKPPSGTAPTNRINAGTYVLEPSVIDRIPEGRKVSIEREIFPALAAEGVLYGAEGSTYWIDVGVPAQYLQAQTDLLAGTNPEPLPASGSDDGRDGREAGVDPSAQIDPGAEVSLSVVGAGAVIEPGARVDGAVLLAGARVERDARVSGSVIGENAVVGAGAEVTELSVIGDGEKVGEGVRLRATKVPDPDRTD